MRYTVNLREADINMMAQVGRKAAYLGTLMKKGLNVPKGFVVTSEAFRDHVSVRVNENGEEEPVVDISPVLRDELYFMFDSLGSRYVAVRSTVTAVMGGRSYAGNYETELFVSRDDLLQAVERVWKSFYSSKAREYRMEVGEEIPIALLIQEMVNPEAAGVAYSIHPVTLTPQVYIESTFGLGEGVTKGIVIPDIYTVDKLSKRIDVVISEKKVGFYLDPSSRKVVKVELDRETSTSPSLDTPEVLAIANLVQRVEETFRRPVEIEWALTEMGLYLLEARSALSGALRAAELSE